MCQYGTVEQARKGGSNRLGRCAKQSGGYRPGKANGCQTYHCGWDGYVKAGEAPGYEYGTIYDGPFIDQTNPPDPPQPYPITTNYSVTFYKDEGHLYKTVNPYTSVQFTNCITTGHALYPCYGNGRSYQDPNTLGTYEGVAADIPTTFLSPGVSSYNLWQSDQVEDRVHKIAWNGGTNTFSAPVDYFEITNPTDVAVDSENNVWGISVASDHKKHYQLSPNTVFPSGGFCTWPASSENLWNYGSYFNDEYVEYVLTRNPDPSVMTDSAAVSLYAELSAAADSSKRGIARTWMTLYGTTFTTGLSVYPNYSTNGTYSISRTAATNSTQPNSDETGLQYIIANNLEYFSHPSIDHPDPTYPTMRFILEGQSSAPSLEDKLFWGDQKASDYYGTSGYDDFTVKMTLSTTNIHTFNILGYNFAFDDKLVDLCGDTACACAGTYPNCGQNPTDAIELAGSYTNIENIYYYVYHDPSKSGKPLNRWNGAPGEEDGVYTPQASAIINADCYLFEGDYTTFYGLATSYIGTVIAAMDNENKYVNVYERWPTAEFYISAYDNLNCIPTAWDNWTPLAPAGDNGLSLDSADRIVSGYDPLSASFTDTSIGRTWPLCAWYWTFGDNTTYLGFDLPILSTQCGGPHTITETVTTADPNYSPRDDYDTDHVDMVDHFYRGVGTYYATLWVQASSTGTDSWNISSGITDYAQMSSTFTIAASRRIDVIEACPLSIFQVTSGTTVTSNYSDSAGEFFDVGLSGVNAYVNSTGSYISGYAPNLTVVFYGSAVPRSYPISALEWDFDDYYNEQTTYTDSYGTNRQNNVTTSNYFGAPISGWPTWNLPNGANYDASVIHTFTMPGYYTVTLNAVASSDAYTNSCSPYSITRNVYVKEIDPIMCVETTNLSGSAPLTVTINPSCTIPGSFQICRIDYDFGDGSDIHTVSRLMSSQYTYTQGMTAYPDDILDPRNILINHQYSRTLTSQPSTYTLYASAYACNTNTVGIISAGVTIGPITLPDSSLINNKIHLIKNRLYNKDNDLLYVFENENNLETYNIILSAGDL